MNRSPAVMLFWLGLFTLFAIGLTVAAFYTLILPEDREATFYSVMVSLCVAEMILFGYLAYLATVPESVERPSPAARMRILVLVVIWFVIMLIAGSIAVHPSQADTFYSDKIILLESIVTFLFLLGAFFVHGQDVSIQVRDEVPQQGSIQLQTYAGGVDELVDAIRRLQERCPDSSLVLDRLGTRLDTLKTQLTAVSPVTDRPMGRLAEPVSSEQIETRLRELRKVVLGLRDANEAELDGVGERVDSLISLLRRREDMTTF